MMDGWIKMHRKALDNPLFRKPYVWHFFQYCLLKANHSDQEIQHGGKTMTIPRGCFVFGRKKAAEETGLTEQNIRTALMILGGAKALARPPRLATSKFSVVEVCNYSLYQASEPGYQPANQPATNQQLTTNKKVKKEKKDVPSTTLQEHKAEFDSWFERYKATSSCPAGKPNLAFKKYVANRKKYSKEQVELATRHYFQEKRASGEKEAHAATFLNPKEDMIGYYQEPPHIPVQQGQFSAEEHGWKPASEHYGPETDLLKDYEDSLKMEGSPYAN